MGLTLGQAVRKIRLHAGETQERMAAVVGITNVHLSRVETDKQVPSERILEEIRGLYGFCPRLMVAIAWVESGVTDKRLESITAHRALIGFKVD